MYFFISYKTKRFLISYIYATQLNVHASILYYGGSRKQFVTQSNIYLRITDSFSFLECVQNEYL